MILADEVNNNTNLVITIVVVIGIILLIVLILGLIFYPIIKRQYMYRNFRLVYYKKIYSIAEKNDYFLINNLVLKNNNIDLCQIDHILFAKKYIYVIKDRFYRGAISGEKDDSIWLYTNREGKKSEIHNPLMNNLKRIEKLSAITQMDNELFISIVVVNNDCIIKNPKMLNSKKSYIVSCRNLPKLISSIEKKAKVDDIDQDLLGHAVQDIYRSFGEGRKDVESEN